MRAGQRRPVVQASALADFRNAICWLCEPLAVRPRALHAIAIHAMPGRSRVTAHNESATAPAQVESEIRFAGETKHLNLLRRQRYSQGRSRWCGTTTAGERQTECACYRFAKVLAGQRYADRLLLGHLYRFEGRLDRWRAAERSLPATLRHSWVGAGGTRSAPATLGDPQVWWAARRSVRDTFEEGRSRNVRGDRSVHRLGGEGLRFRFDALVRVSGPAPHRSL